MLNTWKITLPKKNYCKLVFTSEAYIMLKPLHLPTAAQRWKRYDSATVEAYENSYVEDCIGNIRPQSDYAIVKDYYGHKIYIKKGKFEIIEV